jgi:hypothetical protein
MGVAEPVDSLPRQSSDMQTAIWVQMAISTRSASQRIETDRRNTIPHTGDQKKNFTAPCTSRGGAAFTTWPNRLLLMSPFTAKGPKKLA